MRLLDVHDEERDPIAVLLVKAIQLGDPRAKRRSRVAAEDEDHRLLTVFVRQRDRAVASKNGQGKVRRRITDLEVAGARGHPERFEGQRDHRDAGDVGHDAAEGFRRLPHRRIERGGRDAPEQGDRDKTRGGDLQNAARAPHAGKCSAIHISFISSCDSKPTQSGKTAARSRDQLDSRLSGNVASISEQPVIPHGPDRDLTVAEALPRPQT